MTKCNVSAKGALALNLCDGALNTIVVSVILSVLRYTKRVTQKQKDAAFCDGNSPPSCAVRSGAILATGIGKRQKDCLFVKSHFACEDECVTLQHSSLALLISLTYLQALGTEFVDVTHITVLFYF